MDKKFTEKDSLELISQMIRNTQQKLEQGSGNYFLLWGYATIVAAIAVTIALSQTNNYNYYMLYFIIPAIGLPGLFLLKKKEKSEKYISTYIDRIIGNVWTVFGTVAFLVSLAIFFKLFPILAVMALLMGMGITITGLIIKTNFLIVAGIISIAGTIPLLLIHGHYSNLIFAGIFLLSMVVPGHILNTKGKKRHV